jgi:hypothetical protein
VPGSSSPAAVVAEYGTRFEADVAQACLTDQGIESVVRADPAHAVAPHLVTMRGFRLEVHRDDVDMARTALGLDSPPDPEAERLDREFFHVPFAQRPRWIRWLAVTGIVAVAGPAIVTAVVLVIAILGRLAPG